MSDSLDSADILFVVYVGSFNEFGYADSIGEAASSNNTHCPTYLRRLAGPLESPAMDCTPSTMPYPIRI